MRHCWETTSVVTQQRQFISTRGTGTQPNRRRCTRYEALHPLRSTTPVKERCTRSERVQCLPMGCTAPSATSTNAESPTKVQPDREHSTRSERVEPYRPDATHHNKLECGSTRIPGVHSQAVPCTSSRQARTQRQNSRGRGEARTTGRYLGELHPKSHVIYLGQFSTGTTNVAIATTVFQNLKG